jgi:hypothetical protein
MVNKPDFLVTHHEDALEDVTKPQILEVQEAILQGYKDWANGAYYQSTGCFFKDREIVARKEAEGWK